MTAFPWIEPQPIAGKLVVSLAGGGFVSVVTRSETRAPFTFDFSSFAQLYDANLVPVGSEFRVGVDPTTLPPNFVLRGDIATDVAAMPDGTFIVGIQRALSTFNGPGDEDENYDAYYQRFDASGGALSTPVQIAGGGNGQNGVQIAPLGSGHVAVWQERFGIFGGNIHLQRYASDGAAVGAAVKINVASTEVRSFEAVELDGGRLLVRWGAAQGSFFRIYETNGDPVIGETAFAYESIEALDNGRWAAVRRDGTTLYARIFDENGVAVSADVQVNTTVGSGSHFGLAALTGGAFIVAWKDANGEQILGQVIDAAGVKRGAEDIMGATSSAAPILDVIPAGDGRFLLHVTDTTIGGHPSTAQILFATVQQIAGSALADALVGDGVLGDSIAGFDGNDDLRGFGGTDRLNGGYGNDSLYGGSEADFLNGGAGDDYLQGDGGGDRLLGEDGEDTVYGLDGDDELSGSYGNDSLFGGLGDDLLIGGRNNDYLAGQDGDDRHYGEEGSDYIYGLGGRDFADGGYDVDSLFGGLGDDVLDGGYGDDYLQGDAGNDALHGRDGDDYAYGLDGDDYIEGGFGIDSLFGGNGADVIYAGADNDYASGGAAADRLVGEAGDDYAYGGTGADILEGREGSDSLYGNEDNDSLYGGNGADYLFAGAGDDQLVGDAGDDRMFGEAGADTFVHRGGVDGFDVVVDFAGGASGTDILRLLGAGFADGGAVISAAVDVGYGVVIATGSGSQVILEGVSKATLDPGDFLIA